MSPAELERFLVKIEVATSGCWLWTGSRPPSAEGYGFFSVRIEGKSRSIRAHKVAFEHWNGTLGAGLTIDHLCRVRHCVNPTHLEEVTRVENVLRADGCCVRNAAKETCPRGHVLDGVNSDGRRFCRTCRQEQQSRYDRAHRKDRLEYHRAYQRARRANEKAAAVAR